MERHRNIIPASMTRYKARFLPYVLVKSLGIAQQSWRAATFIAVVDGCCGEDRKKPRLKTSAEQQIS